VGTAARIAETLRALGPREIVTGLGGTGVAAIFGEGDAGLLIRCELDALPIFETGQPDWRSERPGKAHLCGHDGHMAILHAVAQSLSRVPPKARVILLFQPAEEIGSGAEAVLTDPNFSRLGAQKAISLHNMPGLPLGSVALKEGPVNCASRGLRIRLTGRTAHAAQPDTGQSPGVAMARLIPALGALSRDLPLDDPDFRLATVTHARLGEATFGVAPGEAEIFVTLRTLLDDRMAALEAEARALVTEAAAGFGQHIEVSEPFGHCVNHPDATGLLRQATAHLPQHPEGQPMRASEDFGRFGAHMPSAMFLLGAGEQTPALHNPDYDFPDVLIETGAQVFLNAIALHEAEA
jgi:amidohydrolase